ncbi:MAG TPA: hypothetical protein VK601_19420, partial [Kofleriaceae bacterium]|nr:hypothetical protein [Kofleriaceae bacterium]
ISKGDVDPRVAVPAIRPYLADKKHVVLAALGLARMGEDMASAVPQIAEHLDATDEYELKEVLDALAQIGPGARAALPRLATLTKRLDAYCLRPVRADRLVEVVAALATRPDDAGAALPALTPFLSRCPDAFQRAIGTLAKLGNDGWKPLLSYLRDDDRPAGARHEVARVVMRAGAPTTKADQEVVRLLEAREARRPPPRPESMSQLPDPPPPEPDPLIVTEEGVAMCRAEAGRPPVAVTGITAEQARKVGPCLKGYLCGPSQRTFTQTLDRCCGPVFGAQRPAFCRP